MNEAGSRVDELELSLPDGSSVALGRQAAADVAGRLWARGLDVPGAIAAAARIEEELQSRSRFSGRIVFGPREGAAVRAILDAES
jgi:hypothetical protein